MWRNRVRELAAMTGALALTLGVTVWGASPASAEGPTSGEAATAGRDVPDLAMIVAGGTGQTTVLRSGEPAFAGLRRLLRPTYTGTERVPEDWAEGDYPPVDITVIWGLTGIGGWPQTNSPPGGDVAVVRQDQLLVAPDGTPWIRSDPAPDVQDDDIRWHRAPLSIFVDMEQHHVLDGLGDRTAGSVPAPDHRGLHDVTGRSEDSVRWAVPGLAVGLAAGAGGTLLIRRAAARQGAGPPREEPRQELIDL